MQASCGLSRKGHFALDGSSSMRSSRRRLQGRVVAGLARAGLALAFMLVGIAASSARDVTVRGAEMNRYGRIALEFDQPTKVSARVANGILVLSFGAPATVKNERLGLDMPSYVSAVRRDPDSTGLRLALMGTYRPSVLEAGEKVFVDLLPETWTGLPPALPSDVVTELARRAREAELKLRDDTRRKQAEPLKSVALRVAQLPTLTRIVFEPPGVVPISFKASGAEVEILFDAPLTLDPAQAKGRLASVVRNLSASPSNSSLLVTMTLEPGREARGFREDDTFVVDIAKPKAEQRTSEAGVAPPKPPEEGRRDGTAPDSPPPQPKASGEPKAGLEGKLGSEPKRDATPAADQAKPRAELGAARPELGAARPETSAARFEPAPARPASVAPQGPVQPDVIVADKGMKITFPFREKTAAAAFERAGVVTAVFHTPDTVNLKALPPEAAPYAALGDVVREGAFAVVRLRLAKPQLMRLAPQGNAWVLTVGDKGIVPSEPLPVTRALDEAGRTVVAIPLADSSGVHWTDEPGSGERIAVATAFGGPRGLPKPQRFVEFQLLATAHGVAAVARADDVVVRSGVDGVAISRGAGLAVSLPGSGEGAQPGFASGSDPVIMRERWAEEQLGSTLQRRRELMREVADAPRPARSAGRLNLAHFLLANGLDMEASSVLAYAAIEDPMLVQQRPFGLLQGVAAIRLRRPAEARKILSAPTLTDDPEGILWRAVLDAQAGRWSQALTGLRRVKAQVDAYPDDLQGTIRLLAARAGLALRDFAAADAELGALAPLPLGPDAKDEAALLKARVDAGLGHLDVAVPALKQVAEKAARPIAAEATLHWIALALQDGSMTRDEAIGRLETLSVTWRGDDIEVRTIGQLGRLYAEEGRWRDAFTVARRANRFFPDHEVTRTLHDDTARLFEELFLSGKGETLNRIDSLALYFDFKEFTPIGRRGDEIVRRLADRLIELDLLEQAGDLLQYQIDKRLTGAARATVAARLAMIRLMDGKPAQALQAIQTTRIAELPNSINRARLLLEARALSDLSRTDLAVEVLQGETGAEIDRLKADILWTGRRWREAGEAHEYLVGTRWQGPGALSDQERGDVIRAVIAYGLADDAIALDRIRAKFAAKMADSADARTFAFMTQPNVSSTRAFRDLARGAASAETLTGFLAEYRKRYPEASAAARPRRSPAGPAGPAAPGPGAPAAPQAQAAEPAASPKG